MYSRFRKILFFVFAAVICSSFFWFYVQAADVNQGVNVNLVVPGGGGGGGGGGGTPDTPPVISSVVTSVSFTTATITWSATDDLGVISESFFYGLTNSYGSSTPVTGAYRTSLSGLATGTLYYFKISVTDTGSHTTEYTGTFTTSPAPPDTTPPIITNVQVVAGVTTSGIKWDTNELADSQVNYGLTNSYGSNFFDSTSALAHSVLLVSLIPNTTYHFQIISTDGSGNSANTADSTFTTAADNISPPDVTNFILTTTTNSIVLSWTNPSLASTPDFTFVKVVRKIGSASANPSDGTVVYTGSGQNFSDTSVALNTNYFYTIFSFDTSNNHSPGIFRNGKIFSTSNPPLVEICGNGIDDNNNGLIDCADPACSSLPACVTPTPTTTPSSSPPTPVPEICNNGIDDNLNGKIDCADSACSGYSGCLVAVPECRNGIDDDGDGLIDYPADPGCISSNDNDEYNPPTTTVPEFTKINLADLSFLVGNRQIKLVPVGDMVTGLSGANFTVAVPASVLASAPQTMILRVGDTDQHQFVYNAADKMYYADLSFSGVGLAQVYLEVDYGSGQLDSVAFKLNSLPWGEVVDSQGKAVAGVEIGIYKTDGTKVEMANYGQTSPLITGVNGEYGWMVPSGDFRVDLYKDGYYDRSITINNVDNHIINSQLTLIARPPKLDFATSTQNIIKALAGQTKVFAIVAVQKINDAVANPVVQQVNQQVVAPTAITVVAVSAVSFISWMDILPFLRLLFLQPLMLLGWRKREKWGLVYNALNKLPVDLATVRLVDLATNKVVQSKVTDTKGRFIFMVDPGKYKLEVQKNNFISPSNLLAGYKSDGQKVDIYHGEPIEVIKPSGIIANIPLDPAGAGKKPARLAWERFARGLQTVLSSAGILVAAISLYISPKLYTGILLVAQILIFFIFRRLAVPTKPKNWGIVYDEGNKAPIGRVVARLFNSQFNKLVDTQITDAGGKYYFLAGDGKYYVTYEHKAYHPQKTDIIDLEGKEAEVITKDVSLKKN